MKYGGKSNTYNGFTSMMINPAGITLYASCIDRKIYAYNLLTYSTYPGTKFRLFFKINYVLFLSNDTH